MTQFPGLDQTTNFAPSILACSRGGEGDESTSTDENTLCRRLEDDGGGAEAALVMRTEGGFVGSEMAFPPITFTVELFPHFQRSANGTTYYHHFTISL